MCPSIPCFVADMSLQQIRNAAADLLYLDSTSDILASCDWNAPVSKTKPVVIELRKHLGVTTQ